MDFRITADGKRNCWSMDRDTEKKAERDRREEQAGLEEREVRMELSRWFFLLGFVLAILLQLFFDVFLVYGLIIFEGIAAAAAVILKILDKKR